MVGFERGTELGAHSLSGTPYFGVIGQNGADWEKVVKSGGTALGEKWWHRWAWGGGKKIRAGDIG